MSKEKNKFIYIVHIFFIIVLDLFVYMILGFLNMEYEDHYNKSKGDLWSLTSMNTIEKIYFLGLQIWNILNILGLVLLGRSIYIRIKKKKHPKDLSKKY